MFSYSFSDNTNTPLLLYVLGDVSTPRTISSFLKCNELSLSIFLDKSRIDFTLETFDRERIPGWFEKSNEIIAKKLPVEKSFMTRDEAYKLPGFATVSPHLVKGFDTLRVVNIEGFDSQPCGGTHLDNIGEIGEELKKAL